MSAKFMHFILLILQYQNKLVMAIYGRKNEISYGDRIFVRLTLAGKSVAEFTINKVRDMTELIGELRKYTRGLRGLARLAIHNMSRGWSTERPLMLYTSPAGRTPGASLQASVVQAATAQPRRMLFPWETH